MFVSFPSVFWWDNPEKNLLQVSAMFSAWTLESLTDSEGICSCDQAQGISAQGSQLKQVPPCWTALNHSQTAGIGVRIIACYAGHWMWRLFYDMLVTLVDIYSIALCFWCNDHRIWKCKADPVTALNPWKWKLACQWWLAAQAMLLLLFLNMLLLRRP